MLNIYEMCSMCRAYQYTCVKYACRTIYELAGVSSGGAIRCRGILHDTWFKRFMLNSASFFLAHRTAPHLLFADDDDVLACVEDFLRFMVTFTFAVDMCCFTAPAPCTLVQNVNTNLLGSN